jgi:membrane-associated phospholipid phosphatase
LISAKKKKPIFFPCELAVIGFGVLTLVLYWYFNLPLRDPWRLYREKVGGGLVWYGTGLPLCLLLRRLGEIRAASGTHRAVGWLLTWERYRRDFLSSTSLIRDLRLVHALALCFVFFINLKNLIPLLNTALYDEQFIRWERYLCFGKLCAERAIDVLGVAATQVMSSCYVFFFPYMGLLLMTMVLQRNSKLAAEFCLSFVLVWFIGVIIVYLVPTLGPCYAAPDLLPPLPESETTDLRQMLWQFKVLVEQQPDNKHLAYLIAGFPSLHLAVPVLGSLYLRRIHWVLSSLSWLFCLLTVVTTLYFGWHYLLDDVGAFLLALFVYVAAGHVYAGLERNNASKIE